MNTILIENSFIRAKLTDFKKVNNESRREVERKFGPTVSESIKVIQEREQWVDKMENKINTINREICDIRYESLSGSLDVFKLEYKKSKLIAA